MRRMRWRRKTDHRPPTTDHRGTQPAIVGGSSSALRRKILRLLRRRPLVMLCTIIMVLAAGAVTAASAAGLRLVEPHAQLYPVSLLSALAADYQPWRDANPRGRRLDPAIIKEAARDEAARDVKLAPG